MWIETQFKTEYQSKAESTKIISFSARNKFNYKN